MLKISLITVTYNSEATIRDTLESVAHQTHQNLEHIIVDGASQDQTVHIVARYPHVTTLISAPDTGIYQAMNKGLQYAKGDLIGILNSDDFYASNDAIEKIVLHFNQNPLIQAVYADLVYVDSIETDKITRIWKAGAFHKKQFLNGWTLPHPTFFVRKTVYEQYGYFNETFKIAADYELIFRFLYKNEIKVGYLPITIIKMRTGGASNGSFKKRLLAHREDKLAWSLNQLQPHFYTIYLKPIRKIGQFRFFSKLKAHFRAFYE